MGVVELDVAKLQIVFYIHVWQTFALTVHANTAQPSHQLCRRLM